MSASGLGNPQGPGVPDRGRSVSPGREDVSTPRLQCEINQGRDLAKVDVFELRDLISALTKDPSTIRRIRIDIVEQQGHMDLQRQLDAEKLFRKRITSQIEYTMKLKTVGEGKGISGAHRLSQALGELEGFLNASRRHQDVILQLAAGAKVRLKREQAEANPPQLNPSQVPLGSLPPTATSMPSSTATNASERIDRLNLEVEVQKSMVARLRVELENRPLAPDAGVEVLRGQLAEVTAELSRMAIDLNERMVTQLLDTGIAADGHSAAIEERISVLETILRELTSAKKEMFDPSLEACGELIQRLKIAGHDTSVYEESLEQGNVGAVLTTERFLREIVGRVEKVHGAIDPGLLNALSELEGEVASRVTDARLRVVPSGLIRFCRELLADANDPAEVAPRVRTVEKIMGLVKQYIG